MAETLGIVVSSDKHLDHLLGLCKAAERSGRDVIIFLTARGVLLTQDPRFPELGEYPKISLCNVGFDAFGLKKPVPLVDDKDFATQTRHAMLIEDCDRYVVL
jgi:hypothetical protein